MTFSFPTRLSPLGIAAGMLTAAGGPALAQGPQPARLEEVSVVAAPIKGSQQEALDAKKMADNFIDVISADTIGRFPDQNLADSLGRLPGLAIERDQGQARYINLRGAPFRYTSIAFDGIDVPGAENGRIPRFDSFPSVITSRVEVNKAVLPSMPGEAVAGFINIHTFSPFARQGWGMFADIGMGEQELGDGDIDKYAIRASWSNDSVGFMAFASENRREQITDNREYALERSESGDLIANELDFRNYKVTREDRAYGGTLEYRGDGALQRLFASSIYTEFVDEEERNQFVFSIVDPQPGAVASNKGVGVSRMLEYGEYENSTFSNTLGSDFVLADWHLEARLNLTKTESLVDLPIPRSMGASAMADYDLTDIEDPTLTLDRDLAGIDYPLTLGIRYGQKLDIDAHKLKLDGERDFRWFGQDAVLRLGTQLDRREADGYVTSPAVNPFPETIDIDSFNTGVSWESNTTNSIGGTYYDNKGLLNAWRANGLGAMAVNPADEIALEEDINAAYIMATTHLRWGNIVAGVRIEQTDYSSEGTIDGEHIDVSDDFVNYLPSVHVNVDLAEDLKWRVSASTGVNRPTYDEWRAAASVNLTSQPPEVTGGNPTLEAEETVGMDTSLEWYFAPASIVSVGAFYREIDNVIYADSSTIDGGAYLSSATGEEWIYTGAVNGDDGEMTGVEFNVIAHAVDLIEALDGFGISANATILDSEFQGLDGVTYELPGTSDLIYNASLFYENFGLSTRINYQYRDEWISPIEDPSEYWGEQERVDLSISYELPFEVQGGANIPLSQCQQSNR